MINIDFNTKFLIGFLFLIIHIWSSFNYFALIDIFNLNEWFFSSLFIKFGIIDIKTGLRIFNWILSILIGVFNCLVCNLFKFQVMFDFIVLL